MRQSFTSLFGARTRQSVVQNLPVCIASKGGPKVRHPNRRRALRRSVEPLQENGAFRERSKLDRTIIWRNVESVETNLPTEKRQGTISEEFGRERCLDNGKTELFIV